MLTNLDNQLRTSVNNKGLAFLQPPKDGVSGWGNWQQWPYASLAIDLGSDGFCAFNALENMVGWKLNIDLWPDVAHGWNRDFELLLRHTKLKGFWMAMMVSWNLPYGPKREHQRKHELRYHP